MNSKSAREKYSHPHFRTLCFMCTFGSFDTVNPARMGFCSIQKKPENAITAKLKCDRFRTVTGV